MTQIIIALIVLFFVCAIWLVFADGRQGSRQPTLFCCLHCRAYKPASQLSTAMHQMCKKCADVYERVQDEP